MCKKFSCLYKILYPFSIFLLIIIGIPFIIGLVGIQIKPTQSIILILIVQGISLCSFYGIYKYQNKGIEYQYKLLDYGFKNIALTFFSTYFVLNLIGLITIIFKLNELFPNYSKGWNVITSGSFIVQLLALGIMAPIAEELLFRGIIYNRIKEISALPIAALTSSLLWAVAHLNVVQGISTFIFGFFLAFVYEKYKTLWVPILCHIFMNFIAVISGRFLTATDSAKNSNIDVAANPLYINIISLGIDLTIVAVLIYFLNRAQFPRKPKEITVAEATTSESDDIKE